METEVMEMEVEDSESVTSTESRGLVISSKGEEEYQVERVVGKKMISGVVQYRIKWLGWDRKFNTWEPIENLRNCIGMIDEFESKRLAKAGESAVACAAEASPAGKCAVEASSRKCTEEKRGRKRKQQVSMEWMEDVRKQLEEEARKRQENNAEMEWYAYYMGPLFRRVWNNNEIPIGIVGSTTYNGCLLHLVKIRKANEPADLLGELNLYKGLNEDNVVIVVGDVFKLRFPDVLIKYYESNIEMCENVADEEEIREKVETALKRRCRKIGFINAEVTVEKDSFGLPYTYESDESENSCDSSSEEFDENKRKSKSSKG